ncbi:glycosyltransferase [Mesobacillus foraminis]|uniref:Glycosyltransferase involved in cell wall biosynthesis n=1 Tax=Mesobacillus foraminis TaxID=279826 RepID=A0A4R2B613_9BACI|nr:glycosyltransferase [Mesobacillus foraminis]TCN22198.1 glycosyltransferase involved in cell wall biosynthesis [Mesobacillus foraminis]
MKKKLLIVIDSLVIGGAEKSLVSLLNILDLTKFEIELILFKKGGDLEKYIPSGITLLPVPEYFRYTSGEKMHISKKIKYSLYKLKTSIQLRLNQYKKNVLHSEQVVFKNIKEAIPQIQKRYDAAIAYSQGMPTYFVAHKVNAKKKLAWINTDYVNTLYDKQLDYQSYKEFNKIITVSQNTKESVGKIRPEYYSKVDIMLDIINPEMIYEMADDFNVKEFDKSIINILTVGRLASVKSYDTAIEVASLLKKDKYKFKWYVIGEGTERDKMEYLIQKYDLVDNFVLLGKKINPYPFMKNCDLYVQTSIKEGFGLTVCEAKILKKPIVCTDFPTAGEIINNHIDGLIVKHGVMNVYMGIKKYLDDKYFQKKIIDELRFGKPYSSINQLEKFYELLN